MAEQSPYQAEILGVHLEGPFISPDMLGAQQNRPMMDQNKYADTGPLVFMQHSRYLCSGPIVKPVRSSTA